MINKTLSERIAELNEIKKSYEFEPTNNEFFKAMKVIEELQAENKSWQEMVDSTNQTNQAMGNMLNEFEAKVKELEEENQILKSRLKKISDAFEDDYTSYDEIELMAKGTI